MHGAIRLPASRRRGRARPGRPSPRTRRVLRRGRGQGGLSRHQGMPRRGGRLARCAVVGQGGLGSGFSVGQLEGGMSDKVAYNTYEPLGAGVGTRVPWPPVPAVLGGGVAVRHGRCSSAGRGAQGGAPAEEGASQVHRRCMRCWPLPASPGLGRRCSPGSRVRPVAPGASPRGAPCPPDGGAQPRSTRLCRVAHGPRGLGSPPPGRWGCRSVPPLGGAGDGRGTVVLLRQGPPSVRVCAALTDVTVGAWMRLRGADRGAERRGVSEGWRCPQCLSVGSAGVCCSVPVMGEQSALVSSAGSR